MKLVNIRNDDITDGNPKLTLGLIWTIILHFQVSQLFLCCLFVQVKMFEGCPPCLFLTRWNYEDMPGFSYWNWFGCFVLVSFCCMTSILVQCFSSLDLLGNMIYMQKLLSFCSSFSDHKRSDMYLLEGVQIFSEMRQMYSLLCIYFSLWLWYVTNITLFGYCISANTYSVYMLAWEAKHAVIL